MDNSNGNYIRIPICKYQHDDTPKLLNLVETQGEEQEQIIVNATRQCSIPRNKSQIKDSGVQIHIKAITNLGYNFTQQTRQDKTHQSSLAILILFLFLVDLFYCSLVVVALWNGSGAFRD